MKKLYLSVLSWLLFQANKVGSNKYYYDIKNKLIKKYGRHTGYVVQYIPGKKCRSCGGTGTFYRLSRLDHTPTYYPCFNCCNGWYKKPVWNILSTVEFGAYGFLQPYKRSNENPDTAIPSFEGYVDHKPTRYSRFALFILLLCFEKGYLKRWWKWQGTGWYSNWKKPSNFLSNIIHLLKRGKNSIPILNIKRSIDRNRIKRQLSRPDYIEPIPDDGLPF